MGMIAYHGRQDIKDEAVTRIRAHAAADNLIQGYGYWEDGKGCAVGCQIESGDHAEYEARFGIPQMLARLEDCIFEGLPVEDARQWPERFMVAIQPGADLSRVGWQFLHWLLTDETVNPGISHPSVREAVKQCADAIAPMTKGLPVDGVTAQATARSAEWAAESAARSAAAYVKMADKLISLTEAA